MSDNLSAQEIECRRELETDKKFGGLQLQDFSTDTISQINRAQKNVLKVAIHPPNLDPQLYIIDQEKSLKDNIEDFCRSWKIENYNDYALLSLDSGFYITEGTRHDVKDGAVLKLVPSPTKLVEQLIQTLSKPLTPESSFAALREISNNSVDPVFAEEFILRKGLRLIVEIIESGIFGEKLAYALTAFLELMDHGMVRWDDVLTSTFIKLVAKNVNRGADVDATVLQRALGIMECAIVHSHAFYSEIVEAVNVGNLVSHLQRSHPEIQQNTVALLNSFLIKTPIEKGRIVGRRKISDTMIQKQFRSALLNNVIRTSNTINAEMSHQLYVLQVLTLNTYEERLLLPFDASSQEERDKLFELRNIAFDSSLHHQQGHSAFNSRDFQKLGFTNHNNPVLDFAKTPPGILSLDLMIYFARHQQDNYIKFVLENSSRNDSHECPFGKASIEVTQKLTEILKVGEQPTEHGDDYYPMFFSHDHAFEEFFCICIQLFNKTWKEMSAIKDDFEKVMSVFQDQITIALASKSQSFDSFKQRLSQLPYSAILKKRQQEREDKEQFDSQAKPIVDLQERVRPHMVALIKQQRFDYMEKGTIFHKISNKRRDKSRWFCRLSSNHKLLFYGDADDSDDIVGSVGVSDQLAVANIKELVTGKHCPHIKHDRAHKRTADLAFSILFDPEESLNFVAPNKEAWCNWTDGLNALLGKKMTSQKASDDLDVLLSMEMKLRLLDLENVPIPDHAPEIPPLPKNYNFAVSSA